MRKPILLLIVLLFTSHLFAQPANDDCVNAIQLVPSADATCTSTAGTTVGVVSTNYDNCAEFEKRNVWYKFTATAGTHVVQVTFITLQNGIINAFANGCGTLTHLNCGGSGETGPVIQRVLNGLVIGQEYLVAVSTREQSDEGSFNICIFTPPAPPNDNCNAAVPLTINPSNVPATRTTGTTLFATESLPACTGTADDDVWYSFTATQTSHRVFLFNSGNTLSMEAFSGSCGSLVSINCSTPSGVVLSTLLSGLTVGQPYLVRVYSNSSSQSAQGSFDIAVTSAPLNNECVGALTVTPSANGQDNCSSSVPGSTYDATQSSLDCFGGNSTINDTWFSFTATQAVHTIKVFGFGNNVLRFQLFSGTCGSPVSLLCGNPIFSGDTAISKRGGLTAGQVYLLRVYSGNSGGIEGLFNVCITSPVFPANDECINATNLVPATDSTINYTFGTSKGSTNVVLASTCSPNALDVWYRFTASSVQHVVKAVNLTNTSSLVIELYSGACGSLVQQRCGISGDSLFGIGNLTIGQQYYVRVYNGSAFFGDDFNIAVFTPQALANDECINAITIVPTTDASCVETGGTTLGATQSLRDNICYGNILIGEISDVWYKFVASSPSHRVRLIKGTGRLAFQVFSGTCSGLSSLGCSALLTGIEGSGTENRFNGLTVGDTYFIRVLNTAPDETGTFDLCVKTVVIPPNDECVNAVTLTAQSQITFGNFVTGNTIDATQSAQATSCSTGQDDDVWYQFTATQSTMQVVLQNGSIGATRVVVYSGSCAAPVLVKCQLGNVRDNVVVLTGLVSGTNYFVRVYSSAVGSGQGSFSIMVTTQYNPPANDDCINAIELFPSAGNNCAPVKGSTIDASASGNATCVNGNEVWYRFVATASSHRINVDGFVNVPMVNVFSGSCAGLTSVPSTCASGSLQVSVTANSLVIGNTYFVKVLASTTAAFVQSAFNICITTPQVPVNNECNNAIVLPVESDSHGEPSQTFSTNLATFTGIPNCPVLGNDVWFSFVAPAEPVSVEVTALNTNAAIELLSGSCGSLVSVSCNGTTASNVNNIVNGNNLVAGDTYFLRVSSTSFSFPLEFKIKVYRNISARLNASIDSVCLTSNLVQNSGLESDFFIPTSFIGGANPGSEFIPDWRLPTRGTADFFNGLNVTGSAVEIPNNLCFGAQSARNGTGYAGLFAYTSASTSYREYLENELSAPMVPGRRYLVSMYVSLAEFSSIAIDNLGIALRTGQTRELTFTNLNYTTQVTSPDNVFLSDKKAWVNISGVIVADQPYTHLVIGNFKPNVQTDTIRLVDTSALLSGGTFSGCASIQHLAYYFVDDVVVSEINGNVSGCGVLPLDLLSFTGRKQQEKVQLNWKTVNERNTAYFEVQRSSNGIDFTLLRIVNAFNSPGEHDYGLLDETPIAGTNFYRLKQVDQDGRFVMSHIVRVNMGEKVITLRVWPNPVSENLQIAYSGTASKLQLRIFDAAGALVNKQTVNISSTINVNVQSLSKGMYWIELNDGNQVQRSTFIKH